MAEIKGLLNKVFIRTSRRRILFFLTIDIVLIAISMWIAFLIRFETRIPSKYVKNLWLLILIAVAVKVPIFYLQGLYRISWSYVSIRELISVSKGVFYGSLLLGTVLFFLKTAPIFTDFPRSILFIDFFLTLFLIGGFRAAKRIWLQLIKRSPVKGRRTLIVGAGDAGEQLVRSILRADQSDYLPVGFVDDDPSKLGTIIQGVKVLGSRKDIPQLVRAYKVEELLIAIPSAPSVVIRETVELGRKAKVKSIKILPHISELISGKVGLSDVREVQVEDLLGREPVRVDTREIENYLKGKKILVTGAAGSIGSELCRQIARFVPQMLIMLDHEETGLFWINRELREKFHNLKRIAILGDIKDEKKMEWIFTQYSPQIVFHAAAYKHVGMARENPDEAVKNNIFGTKVLGEAALNAGTERFVLISTDKAVNPVGVMGMTKRVAEMVIQDLNRRGSTKFSAVRFGNVLGSRGSVIPIFKEQIKRGGPVTVTHPQMRRYFMTTSEAVLLVLQAAAIGEGGEVFVLDMGKPISILELAKEMIRLSGYEPDKDIPIVITDPDEDEKLFEDILTAEEGTEATRHEQIFKARITTRLGGDELSCYLQKLKELATSGAGQEEIKAILREMIFGHSTS